MLQMNLSKVSAGGPGILMAEQGVVLRAGQVTDEIISPVADGHLLQERTFPR